MAFDYRPVAHEELNGRRYTVYLVEEKDVTEEDFWFIKGLPRVCTITLIEVVLDDAEVDDGVRPEIFLQPLDADDDADLDGDGTKVVIWQTETGSSVIRQVTDLRLTIPSGLIIGRSHATVVGEAEAARVLTRITIADGH